jgi:hypothetical protein
MKAILLITDSEAMPTFERTLLADGRQGFTVLPTTAGSGRHGLKTGDRVHPGGSSLLLTIAEDAAAGSLLERLRSARDAAGHRDDTRIWAFPVEPAD